jgi:acetolactate synthase I/II/III large subunit
MNFPTTHYLSHNERRRELMREADVVLMLEVGDPWAQFNTFNDPHKMQAWAATKDVKIIHVSMQDVYIRANYQDFQRYQFADLAINGDAQTSLPTLIEEVKRQGKGVPGRADKLRAAYTTAKQRTREAAALGWDTSPVTTARLAAELWQVIKNEPWALVVSDRVTWARRLWPMTEYHHALGGSGGQGVGYAAPAAVGAALANKSKGLLSVTFQPDGDLLYAPGVLWTAAYHKIPLLFLMHNNRGYYQEVMHLQRMASLHKRRVDTAWVGNIIDNPPIDFAKLAQSHGVWAEGPINDAKQIGPALQRALKVVKGGAPALVDVVCQPR